MFEKKIKLSYFILIISFVNLLLYHYPIYKFAFNNINYKSIGGILLLISLAILIVLLNAFLFYIVLYISRFLGKFFLVLFALVNAIAVYFINTYSVIIDKTMIGNILNTSFEESSSFFSFNLILYLIFLGIIPSIFIIKTKTIKAKFPKFLKQIFLAFVFIGLLVYVNSSNWLWIDKNSKTLGGLAMPWSYVVNINRFYLHKSQENVKEILLPDATIKDTKKSIAVLVIGESARSKNFSLYGYEKNTNPLLSKIENIHSYKSESCATYTTAGVKCILEHKKTNQLYEILPNYLFRNDVEVIWRTTNWGEPPVHIKNYLKRGDIEKLNNVEPNNFDEILLSGLNEQILASKKNKILVVLHTSTSHGPTYYKKYPEQFKKFTPVCKSVELGKCTKEELMNAYDNTIVYTDYILATLINQLKQLEDYNSSMFYVSDHGESLGEKNLYMHGIPSSIAPNEQLEIPFIVWLSDDAKKLKKNEEVVQQQIFHSVLDFLAIESPIYDKNMSLFKD
ncbi:MAG: phosphoethanolamine--lipid A transferase EptA [Polaribacter sp.]